MSELSEFAKLIAEGKKQRQQEKQQSINEISEFFSAVAKGKVENPTHQIISKIKESVATDLSSLFSQLNPILPAEIKSDPSSSVKETTVEENPIVEQTENPNKVVESEIDKYFRNASFQQPNPDKVDPSIKAIQDKLKFLEQAIGKIAVTGPGSGAGDVYSLDFPTKQVTGDYQIGRKDYYIGVNCDVKSYITLPTTGKNLKDGRLIVIKDESGHAQLTPIKIIGTIDNDVNGAEIRINNGALQLIYRNGSWRVI